MEAVVKLRPKYFPLSLTPRPHFLPDYSRVNESSVMMRWQELSLPLHSNCSGETETQSDTHPEASVSLCWTFLTAVYLSHSRGDSLFHLLRAGCRISVHAQQRQCVCVCVRVRSVHLVKMFEWIFVKSCVMIRMNIYPCKLAFFTWHVVQVLGCLQKNPSFWLEALVSSEQPRFLLHPGASLFPFMSSSGRKQQVRG